MFESLISSRIRRCLFEYIVSHPNDRFYLRGLSKELGLSVSPLRRELKKLERSGMLKAIPEGNMVFYEADKTSAAFVQINSLQSGISVTGVQGAQPIAAPAQSPHRRFSLLIPAAAFAALLLMVAALNVAQQRFSKQLTRLFNRSQAQVTVVVPPVTGSAVMRGAKWSVVPGGFGGGFGTDTRESY